MTKSLRYPGIKEPIEISEDGKTIKYMGKTVHQSLIMPKGAKHGFYQVSISGKPLYVHRLVALLYVHNPKPVSFKRVFHKNRISTDNHKDNIMWGDNSVFSQRLSERNKANPEYRGRSVISHEEAKRVAKRLDNGEHAKDICVEYGVSEMSIARIRKRYCTNKVKSVRYTKEIKENIIKLCEKHPASHVAQISGIPYHTVYRWKKYAMERLEKKKEEIEARKLAIKEE